MQDHRSSVDTVKPGLNGDVPMYSSNDNCLDECGFQATCAKFKLKLYNTNFATLHVASNPHDHASLNFHPVLASLLTNWSPVAEVQTGGVYLSAGDSDTERNVHACAKQLCTGLLSKILPNQLDRATLLFFIGSVLYACPSRGSGCDSEPSNALVVEQFSSSIRSILVMKLASIDDGDDASVGDHYDSLAVCLSSGLVVLHHMSKGNEYLCVKLCLPVILNCITAEESVDKSKLRFQSDRAFDKNGCYTVDMKTCLQQALQQRHSSSPLHGILSPDLVLKTIEFAGADVEALIECDDELSTNTCDIEQTTEMCLRSMINDIRKTWIDIETMHRLVLDYKTDLNRCADSLSTLNDPASLKIRSAVFECQRYTSDGVATVEVDWVISSCLGSSGGLLELYLTAEIGTTDPNISHMTTAPLLLDRLEQRTTSGATVILVPLQCGPITEGVPASVAAHLHGSRCYDSNNQLIPICSSDKLVFKAEELLTWTPKKYLEESGDLQLMSSSILYREEFEVDTNALELLGQIVGCRVVGGPQRNTGGCQRYTEGCEPIDGVHYLLNTDQWIRLVASAANDKGQRTIALLSNSKQILSSVTRQLTQR